MAAAELNNTVLKNNANLVAYYRMESGALTTDSSGNDKTLTDTGTVGEGTGVYGGAADFGTSNTTKHFKRTPDVLTYTDIGTAFAVNVWVNGSSFAAERKVLRYILNNGTLERNFELIVDTSSHAVFKTFDGTSRVVTGTSTIATSTWTMLTIVYDGSAMRLYVNGKHEGTPVAFSWSGYSRTTYSNFAIGAEQLTSGGGVSAYWQGLLDDFAIFSSALSADQIKELYEGRFLGEAWPQSGLVAGWHLNGSSTDFSGNNNHGTDTAITYSQANGKFGQGAGLASASSSKIVITDSASLKPTGNFTISSWMKTSTSGAAQSIFQSYSANGNSAGIRLLISSVSNSIYFLSGKNTGAVNDTDFKDVSGSKVVTDGLWHLATGVYDGSSLSIYIDGNLHLSESWSNNPAYAATNYIRIGATNVSGTDVNFFNGSLDETLVFNRALSAQEIRKMYAVGTGRFT